MNTSWQQRTAWICYGLSVATIVTGGLIAAHRYPGSFDWTRQVISALASQKHNPDGSLWFASALGLGLALIWPASSALREMVSGTRSRVASIAFWTLRAGLVGGMLVGAERAIFFHFSNRLRKGHEALALFTFLLLYAGVLGLELAHLRARNSSRWMTLLVVVPLVAVGASEFVLYLGQRGVGWLDHDWRQSDLALWARFAFWQWLALATLWLAAGHLLYIATRRRFTRPSTDDVASAAGPEVRREDLAKPQRLP